MKSLKFIPLILLLAISGNVGAEWKLTPKTKQAVQPEVARVRAEDPVPPNPSPPAPSPSPTPLPPEPPCQPFVGLPKTLTVQAGGWLSIEADTNCRQVKFKSPDAGLNVFPDGQLVDPLKTVVSSMVPGQYRIMAFAAMADVPAVSEWCIITVTGAQPPPGPAPKPDPTPNPPSPVPVVTATNLTIVTIDEITARLPATNAILNDPFWMTLKSPKFKFYKLDVNSSGVKKKYFAPLALNGGQPCIVIFNADTGAWLNRDEDDLKLPATVTGLQSLLKKYGGQL